MGQFQGRQLISPLIQDAGSDSDDARRVTANFFQAVEMTVMQGSRNYPHDNGDSEDLLWRTFLSGLPRWLRRQLALLDFPKTSKMAERCQVAWNATVGVKPSMPLVSKFPHTGSIHYTDRP